MNQIDRTISFRQDMIDLIIAGKKTVTIRPIKPQPELVEEYDGLFLNIYMRWQGEDLSENDTSWFYKKCPYGQIGDVVPIRERKGIKLRIISIKTANVRSIQVDTWVKDAPGICNYYCDGCAHWNSFYRETDYHYFANPRVWIIEFELVKEQMNEKGKGRKMKMKVEFFHQCNPPTATAQQRQFFGKGKSALTPSAKTASAIWQAIVEPHKPEKPMTGAIEVSIMLTWERKGQVLIESKTTKPDLDNIAKLILDAMTKAGYWVDDAQVSRLQLEKFWGELPGVFVLVQELKSKEAEL